jgi:hypothetical protein
MSTTVPIRRLGAIAIAAAGLIHLVLAPEYFEAQTYLGVLFLLSVPLCSWVAVRLWRGDDRAAWLLGTAVALGMALGFLLSRTVGLPGFHEGEWELLGVVSLVVEIGFALLAGLAMAGSRPDGSGQNNPRPGLFAR